MKQVSESHSLVPRGETFRQAWGIFVFSSMFAVLFNAFYSEGIELKFKAPKAFHLMDKNKDRSQSSLASPGWKNPAPSRTPSPAVAPTPVTEAIPRISLIGAKDRLDKKNCVFLDARLPEQYKEGHIPGAINLYPEEMEKFLTPVLHQMPDKNVEVICYCNGGDCDLSIMVAKALIQVGYTKVEVFEGGWPDWKKSGYPITAGETP